MNTKQLIFLLFCFMLVLTGCKTTSTNEKTPVIIMKEARNAKEHYTLYTDGENIILKNNNEDSETIVKKCLESIKQVLVLPDIEDNEDLPSPEDIKNYIQVTPYTYEIPLESSAKYIYSLEQDGWSIIAEYANYLYRDIYMQLDKKYMRIIVLEDKIKIFDNIKCELPDPKLFINDN